MLLCAQRPVKLGAVCAVRRFIAQWRRPASHYAVRIATHTQGEIMSAIARHQSDSRLSRVVTCNGIAYLAGLTADNRAAPMKAQTEEILKKIDSLLKLAGTDKSRLLSALVYVTDMRLKAQMDEAWIAWVDPKNTPARACVETRLGTPDTLVEIMVIAAQQ
jgi:enamine deaminase RidA (YjgF/YER057c/UK114 family)